MLFSLVSYDKNSLKWCDTNLHQYIPISRFSLSMEMSRLTRGGTAEPASRETKFSGANGDREILIFPVQLITSRVGSNLTRLMHTLLYLRTIHTYIDTINILKTKCMVITYTYNVPTPVYPNFH